MAKLRDCHEKHASATGGGGRMTVRLPWRNHGSSKASSQKDKLQGAHSRTASIDLLLSRPCPMSKRVPSLTHSVISDPASRTHFSSDPSTTSSTDMDEPYLSLHKRISVRPLEAINTGIRKIRPRVRSLKSLPTPSRPETTLYALVVTAAVLGQPRILHGALMILFHVVASFIMKWFHYYAQDQEVIRFFASVQVFLRRVMEEGSKALSGDYGRRVLASYVIVTSMQPGESYIRSALRFHMAIVNKQIVDQIDHTLQAGFLHRSDKGDGTPYSLSTTGTAKNNRLHKSR